MKKLSKIFGICIILSLFLLLSACGGGGGGESVGTAISTGGNHTCGLLSSGAVKCWGHNGYGQLGDGTTVVNSNVPVDVMDGSTLLANVSAISGGGYHTCALTSSGGVKCWGYNEYGELGDGTNNHSNVPVDVLNFP